MNSHKRSVRNGCYNVNQNLALLSISPRVFETVYKEWPEVQGLHRSAVADKIVGTHYLYLYTKDFIDRAVRKENST